MLFVDGGLPMNNGTGVRRPVPTPIMRDVKYDADADKSFECIRCGRISSGQSPPAQCGACGAIEFMNRGMPFE